MPPQQALKETSESRHPAWLLLLFRKLLLCRPLPGVQFCRLAEMKRPLTICQADSCILDTCFQSIFGPKRSLGSAVVMLFLRS